MQLKRNLYYARRDHVQWARVKVDGFDLKIPTEQSARAKLVGKKAQNGRSTIDEGLVRVKHGQIEKPLAPRDFLPEKPPRYEIILIKIIHHH